MSWPTIMCNITTCSPAGGAVLVLGLLQTLIEFTSQPTGVTLATAAGVEREVEPGRSVR